MGAGPKVEAPQKNTKRPNERLCRNEREEMMHLQCSGTLESGEDAKLKNTYVKSVQKLSTSQNQGFISKIPH
jgi:uncharacterized protein YecT (DUF1311 family)